jgi:hypothetical protein
MTSTPENKPSAAFIDKHMTNNLEGVMIYEYLQRKPGVVPDKRELAEFVASLDDSEVLRIVRGHPGLRSLAANMRVDADVLRWARALQ